MLIDTSNSPKNNINPLMVPPPPGKNLTTGKVLMNISAYSMQGKRNHMEDFFDVGYQMKPCDQQRPNQWPYEYFYFGIFDGHGGHEAARFAKENLLKMITKQPEFWSNQDKDVMRAIHKGFADTHSAMRDQMSGWSRTGRVLPSTAGTTASVLFIRNGKFYTGHVGDSRIVISREDPETRQWISDQITQDHKPESFEETERIERAGGEVKNKIGVHRVVWKRPVLKKELDDKLVACIIDDDYSECVNQIPSYPVAETLVDSYQVIPFLAIARSLGDFWSINPYSGQYIVSPEPDVSCRPISPNDKCILLATDGLWNVMNSHQAARVMRELRVRSKGFRDVTPYSCQFFETDNFYHVSDSNGKNHALSVVYMAYQIWERRRLKSDNITAVVAMISDILGPYEKANNKTCTRRASKQSSSDRSSTVVQIEQTHLFYARIRLNETPVFFTAPETGEENDFLRNLEKFLILPPTVFREKLMYDESLITPPRNYTRLSLAKCRRIKRGDSSYSDSYIYIKRVSDDPADERRLPTRISKSGKEVRDASAQAIQSIHDFGQPWDQLTGNRNGMYGSKDVELVFRWELQPGDIVVEDPYEDDELDDEEFNEENMEEEVLDVEEDESKFTDDQHLRKLLKVSDKIRLSV